MFFSSCGPCKLQLVIFYVFLDLVFFIVLGLVLFSRLGGSDNFDTRVSFQGRLIYTPKVCFRFLFNLVAYLL